ncbi:MAG: class I SAM-dependent methyltransferase [Myxococcota bacterium]
MEAVTGERLDDESALYRADRARHLAAYRFARSLFAAEQGAAGEGGRPSLVADLGCGTGYGAADLAEAGLRVVGLDRVRAAERARRAGATFLVGDLTRLPVADGALARVVSFQVVEHFADPSPYLSELARTLSPDGVALISTPNRLESDGENPYHLHEYEADELAALLGRHFERVELLGVHAVGPAARHHAARLAQIRRITALDPLGLRRVLPRRLVEWAFARLARVVRIAMRRGGVELALDESDYPVRAVGPTCLDLLAVCRGPRRRGDRGAPSPAG